MKIQALRAAFLWSILQIAATTSAQLPVASLSQNGILVCSNLLPDSITSVQWASSPSGPWHNDWAGLMSITTPPSGIIQTHVPMFYRVVCSPPPGLALIAAGNFTMGDNLDGESDATPTINVFVSSFYMDTNLVTFAQWHFVYTWATNVGYTFDNSGSGRAGNHPVQTVNWYDALKWCNARSQLFGLTPAYYTDAEFTHVYKTGNVNPYVKWRAAGFRLPTEAEWEKAARGGVNGARFPWGFDTICQGLANYNACTNCYTYDLGPSGYCEYADLTSRPYTTPVGFFQAYPNGYGLCDMAGNVCQWCWDRFGVPIGQPTATDPTGPATGDLRAMRGGCWCDDAYDTRCAARLLAGPLRAADYLGFRCVRSL